MLHEFIGFNRDVIISRTRERVRARAWPFVSTDELERGVPRFLMELSDTLRLATSATPFADGTIRASAARHGEELLAAGFNVSQVVHDYGDICQTITELAVEQSAPITVEEFRTLNRCLDIAIAEAVTGHTRVSAHTRSIKEVERLGQAAHELRDLLNSALLAFRALKRGNVAINGSTGAVLGRSLTGLRDVVDRTLSEVRLAAGRQLRERLPVITLLDEIAAAGLLHAEYRDIAFTVDSIDPALAVDGDPQLLTSAVMNLLQNAIKHTPSCVNVVLRTRAVGVRVFIEIEDECGGVPDGTGDPFQPFGERRGKDRYGLGLGLSMARKAVRAHRGDILIRNMPGKGCIFIINLPLAAADVRCPQTVG